MRITITTPTGNIGSALTERLLDSGADVGLIARDPSKVADFAERGATVFTGSLEDQEVVNEATRGADALFWLTPPNMATDDLRAYQRRLGEVAQKAIRTNGIPYVVHLSSVGAQLGKGVGPVNGLYDVEKLLDDTGANVTHLRPGSFMENFLWQADAIREHSSVFLPISGDVKVPMIATRDIADAAARRILTLDWSGRHVIGLHGPRDVSYNEAAGILGQVLNRPVNHVRISNDQAIESLTGMGATPSLAKTYVEMYEAMDKGTFEISEPRSEETTTPTSFHDWAEKTFGG